MRSIYILFALFLLLATPVAWSQTITLKGTVITDAEEPIAQTRISVSGGFGDNTDDNGSFNIKLSKDFISGEQVLLNVAKEGWVINNPLDGAWNLPNIQFLQVHTTRVIMVPKGSKALWTHDRIEKLVAQLSDEVTQLKATNQQLEAATTEPQPIDFTYYLAEWAETYGFTVDEVKAEFDQWAAKAQGSTEFRTLGLAAFYQKNFAEAARNFEQAAQEDEAALEEIEEAAEQKRLSAFENWKNAGEALYLNYQFDSALLCYQKAASLVTKLSYPNQWAEILLSIGNTQAELGERADGRIALKLLENASESYQQVLDISTQAELTQRWAATLNNIGTVLSALGTRVGGQKGLTYLLKADSLYCIVLEKFSQAKSRQLWAMVHNNRGNVLHALGIRLEGKEGLDSLQQAVNAYKNALQIYTIDELPQHWAWTQNGLGNVYRSIGNRIGWPQGPDYVEWAVQAHREAIKIYTFKKFPQQWAMTQNNLGNSLWDLGVGTGGEKGIMYLKQANSAYDSALWVYTLDTSPQDWAMTQNNIGLTLNNIGIRVEGSDGLPYLRRAVGAYHKALQVRTQKGLPQQWALTQNNLGVALRNLGTRLEGKEGLDSLQQAVSAYQNALLVYKKLEFPQDWAMVHNNLGNIFRDLYYRTEENQRQNYLQQSLEALQNALQVCSPNVLTHRWVMIQDNLAKTYRAAQKNDDAAQIYVSILQVYPWYDTAYNFAVCYYHEVAHNYSRAYALNEKWLEQFPDSLSARTDFAEKQFTTARFDTCAQQIQSLLTEPELPPGSRVALRGILLANALASDLAEAKVQEQFTALRKEITRQEADFTVQWTFNGTKNFISQHEKLAPYRDWLLALFDALDQEDRDEILAALDELEVSLPALARNPK